MRKSLEETWRHLEVNGDTMPRDPSGRPFVPTVMPNHDDEELGYSFFRAGLEDCDLSNLTLPRTFFGRSSFDRVSFAGTDLSESRMSWNDFMDCDFSRADLSACDMRASKFVRCRFTGASLRGADLRRSSFEGCEFAKADLTGTVFHDNCASGWLTEEQRAIMTWVEGDGPGRRVDKQGKPNQALAADRGNRWRFARTTVLRGCRGCRAWAGEGSENIVGPGCTFFWFSERGFMRLPIRLILVTTLMTTSCSRESPPSPKMGVTTAPSETKELEEAKAPPKEVVEKELASLRGVWELVETEFEGRLTKVDPQFRQFRTFQGDEMVDEQQDAPNLTYRGKIKIDPTHNPKTLDFYVLNTKNPVKYVYDLAGDTLRFSSTLNQNGYSKQITGKGVGQSLSLYKRKK